MRLRQIAFLHLLGIIALLTWNILTTHPKNYRPTFHLDDVVWTESPPIIPALALPAQEYEEEMVLTGPRCYQLSRVANLGKLINLLSTHTVVVGSENGILTQMTLLRQDTYRIYEPDPSRWEVVEKTVDLRKVEIFHGLFSDQFEYLVMDVQAGTIHPYDPFDIMAQPVHSRSPIHINASPLRSPTNVLIISHWRYWCYFAERDRELASRFDHIIVLNPQQVSCKRKWVECRHLRELSTIN